MQNKQLAAKFRQIRKLLKDQGETNDFRLMAYDRAARQLEILDKELSDIYTESGDKGLRDYLKEVQAIGEKSFKKIVEFLSTETCAELEVLLANQPVVQESMFSESEMAPKTKRKASKNIDETVNAIRRPWQQAEEVVQRVLPVAAKYFNHMLVCGSYRRKKDTVKDIDIGVAGALDSGANIKDLFTRIQNDLSIPQNRVVKLGEAQTSFYIDSPSGPWQVDFWHVPMESFGSAILFATGSAEYNVGMRQWVKARGYKLNRYGLWRIEKDGDVLVASRTEEEVFAALGLRWLPPEERTLFDAQKQSL